MALERLAADVCDAAVLILADCGEAPRVLEAPVQDLFQRVVASAPEAVEARGARARDGTGRCLVFAAEQLRRLAAGPLQHRRQPRCLGRLRPHGSDSGGTQQEEASAARAKCLEMATSCLVLTVPTATEGEGILGATGEGLE